MGDRPSLPDRIYRALLTLFPREFRGDFGDQMADDFRDQREGARRTSAVLRLWITTVVDAINRAPREHLDILRRDAGYSLRLFRRRPGMTASAILTLAIGIGLNAAVFSIVYAVLWRSLPLPGSEQLVNLSEVGPAPDLELTDVSPANFLDWQKQTRTLDALATINWEPLTIVQQGGAERVEGAGVSADFFRIVPARVVLGRPLNPSDYAPLQAQLAGGDPKAPRAALVPRVVVIGFDLWQRQFGARADIIGQKIPFGGGGSVEIVGVLATDFVFPLAPDAECWLPVVLEPDQRRRARYLRAIGRLAPGRTIEEAQSELDVIARRLAAAHPGANNGRAVRVTALRAHLTAGVRTQLLFLGGTVMCVLLIACLNVSNLLLTHTSGRRRELATHVALGASRSQLVRQMLTEGLLLAGIGGIIGFLLATWTVPWLVARAPTTIPRLHEVTVGPMVLGFTFIISAVVGLLSAAGASLAASRKDMDLSLRSTSTTASSQGRSFRRLVIVGEIALALMLAVAASLLVQTLRDRASARFRSIERDLRRPFTGRRFAKVAMAKRSSRPR